MSKARVPTSEAVRSMTRSLVSPASGAGTDIVADVSPESREDIGLTDLCQGLILAKVTCKDVVMEYLKDLELEVIGIGDINSIVEVK